VTASVDPLRKERRNRRARTHTCDLDGFEELEQRTLAVPPAAAGAGVGESLWRALWFAMAR